MKKTVVFDFDGVIHSYTSGWKGIDVIPDAPNQDVIDAIKSLRADGYEVVVLSTRSADAAGKAAIAAYLDKYGIAVDGIAAEKPPALVYVDDRAVCYRPGLNLVEIIETFEPWRSAAGM
jgi:phosphoglycolate phosphatase-like HAD superfamily hydrolase